MDVPDECYTSLRMACSPETKVGQLIDSAWEVLENRLFDKRTYFMQFTIGNENVYSIVPRYWTVDDLLNIRVGKIRLAYNPSNE